jgi:catechol 2,3-dioxygenase-like lactoylglutathione lyase family enzyme
MAGRVIGLNHVSVPATDFDASLHFYVDVLGLERIPAPNFGFRVEWLRAGDLQLHLYERGDGAAPSQAQHVGLTVDDFMAVYRRVRARDVDEPQPYFRGVYELPGGGVQMYTRDPEGNLVELDHPDAGVVDRDEVPEFQALADLYPQDETNRSSTLFLTHREEAS